ncbi:TetR/AcrR family transcriptional regulator [Streptomyces sp. NPDC049040]|uniref:TetR/AcrR family transcriptional regulator n=1 Tax=Streptomyces sp. NPDC049040 TaxID=3365593 RepID=UPI003719E758
MSEKTADHAPPTGPRAERKRQAIVTAARTVFLRDGFDASVDLIAAEAGVSKVTVYNHFGSKQALFVEVITGALDAPLGDTLTTDVADLADSDDLRAAFTRAARAWVSAIRSDPDVLAMRNLLAREAHRFPELHDAWRHHSPTLHHPAAGAALAELAAAGRLDIPDVELAVVQLYSLLVFPHMMYAAYGAGMDDALAEQLITAGVDMFLTYYAPRG